MSIRVITMPPTSRRTSKRRPKPTNNVKRNGSVEKRNNDVDEMLRKKSRERKKNKVRVILMF